MSVAPIKLTPLPWDSWFFGFAVARLEGSLSSAEALQQALDEARCSQMHLIYAQCMSGDTAARAACLAAGGHFVGAKRTYSRPIYEGLPRVRGPVHADLRPSSRRQLRLLAWQSSEYSRFRVDPQMPTGACRRMFSIWISKSIHGELADVILVVRDGAQIKGMITVKCDGDDGSIGLFAVDARWRGSGIGRQLLAAAAAHCSAAGCHSLRVVAQVENHGACRAYEANGFKHTEDQDIFHFWLSRT